MGGALVGLGGMAYFFYGALKSQVESDLQNILSNKVSLIDGKLAQAETLTDTFRASISALHTQGIQELQGLCSLLRDLRFNRRSSSTGHHWQSFVHIKRH